MRRLYIYDREDWPRFKWDEAVLAPRLGAVRRRQARLLGRVESLGLDLRRETTLESLTDDATKTSEIEGEILDREQVRSSLARRLGLPTATAGPPDRRAEAIAAIVLDATQNFDEPLTAERLFDWHRTLFPDGGHGPNPIIGGAWRDDSLGRMQVVSGSPGRETVHFVAPMASRVPDEMARFLDWFEAPEPSIDPVLKAAVAHIWFVTIHPFDDGNGRIGRAAADLCLARADSVRQRFYSVSAMLRKERTQYYQTLEAVQTRDLDITTRLAWFVEMLDQALDCAEASIDHTLYKSRFWDRANAMSLSERQRGVLDRLLNDFQGKLTSSKWAKMTKCSQDTALRDIDDLISKGLLSRDPAGGRSTSYSLVDLGGPA